MSDLADRLASLTPEKRELLRRRLGRSTPVQLAVDPGPSEPLPLSYEQERLWLADRLDPGNPAYLLTVGVRLRGALNVSALEQALTEIVRRHEPLRTTFLEIDGRPLQRVLPAPAAFPLRRIELAGAPHENREAEAKNVAIGEVRRPFALDTGPLFAAALIRLAPEDHALLLTVLLQRPTERSAGATVRRSVPPGCDTATSSCGNAGTSTGQRCDGRSRHGRWPWAPCRRCSTCRSIVRGLHCRRFAARASFLRSMPN
jgi:hypothetical protein